MPTMISAGMILKAIDLQFNGAADYKDESGHKLPTVFLTFITLLIVLMKWKQF